MRRREARLARALGRFGPRLGDVARVVPLVAAAVSMWHAEVGQIVLNGGDKDSDNLSDTLASRYLPFAVVIPISGTSRDGLTRALPFIASLPARDGRATAYVCRNFVCRRPSRRHRNSKQRCRVESRRTRPVQASVFLLQSPGCAWRSSVGWGNDFATTEVATVPVPAAEAWTDADVRTILQELLRSIERASNPEADRNRPVALRGFSWIVSPFDGGGRTDRRRD